VDEVGKLNNIQSVKIKKIAESNVLAQFVNSEMESRNAKQTFNNFRNRKVYEMYAKVIKGPFTNPEKFASTFDEIVKCHLSSSQFNAEYKAKVQRETDLFNGKEEEDSEEEEEYTPVRKVEE
jgi:hypothetical protein